MSKGRKKVSPADRKVKTSLAFTPQFMRDLDFLVLFTNTSRSAVVEAAAFDRLSSVASSLRALSAAVGCSPDVPFAVSDPLVLSFFRAAHGVDRGTPASAVPFMIFTPQSSSVSPVQESEVIK